MPSARPVHDFIILVVIVLAGLAIRVWNLDQEPFWVDEAESTINALTTLDKGYPAAEYLGIPIFENTLSQKWPGHPEYEFRDLSYSSKGYAIYHGWLPLYAIAGSLALHDISPAGRSRESYAAPTIAELKRLTWAARAPGVAFALLYIICCYFAGLKMYGRDAGFTAALCASLLTSDIQLSTQARYYSAQVLFGTAALLATWLVWQKGRARDYGFAALVFTLLFFTHLTTFAAALTIFVSFAVAGVLRRKNALVWFGLFLAFVGGAAIVWIVLTGFYSQLQVIPPAREYLDLPADLALYPISRAANVVLFSLFALAILVAVRRKIWAERFSAPPRRAGPAVFLLTLWILTAYVLFLGTIPAVSLYEGRLRYCYRGAAVILASIFFASLARMVAPRRSALIAPFVGLALITVSGGSVGEPVRREGRWTSIASFLRYIESANVADYTRLYAQPNGHLILTVYSGLPWQSITPIRRQFLDELPGAILYADWEDFEASKIFLSPKAIRQAAMEAGHSITEEESEHLADKLLIQFYAEPISRRAAFGGGIDSGLLQPYLAEQLAKARRERSRRMGTAGMGPIFRGYRVESWQDWVEVCHYRFSGMEERRGERANFAGRFRRSDVVLLPDDGWVFVHADDSKGDVRFRVIRSGRE